MLPIPPGYEPADQVMFNSWHNYWWPLFGHVFVAVAALFLVALGLLLRFWLRRRR